VIGPEDDWDAAAEGKPAGEGAAVTGTKTVGGYDVRGQPATMRQEESDRYRGIIGAAMERAGWAMEAAKTGSGAILSRFFSMVGGVVSDDGTAPVANQSPVGTGQRGLLDASGAWWARLVSNPDVINWVAERNAIVGEDSRGVPLQGLRVSKEVSAGVTMAAALTGSLGNVAYASLVASQVIQIDRARHQTVRVVYTPGVTGERCILYPQITQGEVPASWSFLPTFQDAVVQLAGPTNPPTMVQQNLGHFGFDPFAEFGTLTAATPYTATFVLGDAYPHRMPACKALRFAIRDTSIVTAGTATIWATQE
jgi:hypothetical protein